MTRPVHVYRVIVDRWPFGWMPVNDPFPSFDRVTAGEEVEEIEDAGGEAHIERGTVGGWERV